MKELHKKRTPVYYNGERFETIKELGDKLGIGKKIWNVTQHYSMEEIYEKDITEYVNKAYAGRCCYIVFNRRFETIVEIAEYVNLPYAVVMMIAYRHKERDVFEKEINKRLETNPICYKDEIYDNLSTLCRAKKIDFGIVCARLSNGASLEEAIGREIREVNNHPHAKQVEFRNKKYGSLRECFNNYGFAASLNNSFRHLFPEVDSLEIFELFLGFIEMNNFKMPEEMITSIPMIYYNGVYYAQAKEFYEEIGVTAREVYHEKGAKVNKGKEIEEVILNMGERLNLHTNERLYPECTINKDDTLMYLRVRFVEFVKNYLEVNVNQKLLG